VPLNKISRAVEKKARPPRRDTAEGYGREKYLDFPVLAAAAAAAQWIHGGDRAREISRVH
jgi:hypothetical protein